MLGRGCLWVIQLKQNAGFKKISNEKTLTLMFSMIPTTRLLVLHVVSVAMTTTFVWLSFSYFYH